MSHHRKGCRTCPYRFFGEGCRYCNILDLGPRSELLFLIVLVLIFNKIRK
ncbi:hypothetical protein [Clostridium sp. DJ247]|nr:hypothetical protein [Clostridium sp. DJ247]MBC2581983.1 hypothetical protein [Clostridium sp. DJ247]